MIIVDTELQKRAAAGTPVRVGMIGAGFMGRGVALQIASAVPGMRVVAIANRHLKGAKRAYAEAGMTDVRVAETTAEIEAGIAAGHAVVTEDPLALARAAPIDAVLEVTGSIENAAHVVLEAIRHGKQIVAMNAELDGTIGPVLKRYADKAGVVFTNVDGDQPGVTLNLYRFVKGIGVTPLLCGNIKGLQDPYRNPTTQDGFARKWKQNVHMVTSFADGTKISFEQAIIANATGMRVAKRGMWGPTVAPGTPLKQAIESFPVDEILAGPGYVDYVVGAEPNPGVFVLGTHDHPLQKHYLNLYKLGAGPLYLFYVPYHLCHFEVPSTIARAVLFKDPVITPLDVPRVEVVTTAKRPLEAGEIIDGLGGYMTYGQAENAETVLAQGLLPIGLAQGCRLRRAIAKDSVLTYKDVAVPADRLCDRLRAEQDAELEGALRAAVA